MSIALVLATSAAATAPCAVQDRRLRATLERHVDAIRRRDMADLEATITRGERLILILPNGVMSESRQAFLDINRGFFADTSWTATLDCASVIETRDSAIATYRMRVSRPAAESQAWLTLTFARERGGWVLVHDQNTRIP